MNALWNDIVHTAMVGTEKKAVQQNLLPGELDELAQTIQRNADDKEDAFLKLSAVMLNYRQAGVMPADEKAAMLTPCEQEVLPYCSPQASGVLQVVLAEDLVPLTVLWLDQCARKSQLVPPAFLPGLLNLAWRNKNLRENVKACIGKRGHWLVQFNPHWQFGKEASPEEIFDTGSIEERKNALRTIRQNDPAKALQLLQQCWSQEQAATRAEFLALLHDGLSLAEEPWLMELMRDKSQKVKEKALALLKSLSGSQIVEEVWAFTAPLLQIKKTSGLLGLTGKTSIEPKLDFEIPAHFKTYGIQDLEANKLYTEREFTLSQLIGFVPPHYWEKQLGLKAAEILDLLSKREETRKYISAFATAANQFKNTEWAVPLYMQYDCWCADLMGLYDFDTRESIALRAISDSHYQRNIELLRPVKDEEWSLGFCLELLRHTSAEPYSFNKNYYRQILPHLPVALAEHLEGIIPADDSVKAYWRTLSEELARLLTIKKQIIASF